MSFDLYVKENYLHATQKIYMLGTKIEIPFGDETTDKDTIIAQLQEELNKYKSGNSVTADLEQQLKDLKEENEQLKRTINILTRSKFCDVNGDDIVGIEDAQLVLRYYTETVAGKTNGDPIEIWYTKQNTISG